MESKFQLQPLTGDNYIVWMERAKAMLMLKGYGVDINDRDAII